MCTYRWLFILVGPAHSASFVVVEFAEAAWRIKRQYPNTRFILLGDLDTNPGATPEVEGWVKKGILAWPSHVLDVRSWLAQASFLVLRSYREGVPGSI